MKTKNDSTILYVLDYLDNLGQFLHVACYIPEVRMIAEEIELFSRNGPVSPCFIFKKIKKDKVMEVISIRIIYGYYKY